jgi:hypothetical protein
MARSTETALALRPRCDEGYPSDNVLRALQSLKGPVVVVDWGDTLVLDSEDVVAFKDRRTGDGWIYSKKALPWEQGRLRRA